jgi:glycosyltransferase involved in cell wall biosynthesis
MSAAPLVSVVIPAYNVAPYIGDALGSVFAQTFTDYEVILVNDGSPDTEALERAIAPYRARIQYLQQKNLGVSAARNAALRAARGEFVAFLDGDDLWLPSFLERQLRVLRERDCDLVSANAMVFGDSKNAGRTTADVLMRDAPEAGEATFLDLLSSAKSLNTSGVLVRLKPVIEVGLFDESMRDAEDFDLWLRLARHKARLAYHGEVLLRYRVRQDGLSGDGINIVSRELRVFDKVERSYGLAADDRDEVLAVIGKRRAELEFELGKLCLLNGDFADARRSFAAASRCGPGWKPRAALWLSRVAPGLLQTLYALRANRTKV